MRVNLVWFTFRDDAAALLQSLRAARHFAPSAAKHVVYDAAAAPSAEALAACRAAGAEVHPDGATDRRGNLNGLANLDAQFRWFERLGGEAAGWTVKIDSDTLLTAPPPGWLSTAGPEHLAVCAVQPDWWFQGPCYALRADLPRHLRDGLAADPRALDALAPKFPEDVCTGHLISRLCGPETIHARPGYSNNTLFSGDQIAHYDFATWPAFDPYRVFQTIHFGRRGGLPKQMPEAVKRLAAARVMAAFLDALQIPP